jgi:hypothetical protein
MKDKAQENAVSPQKVAANRRNAKQSTGPRTPQGKQRASQNSYKHGFFGLRLFPNSTVISQDGADYDAILAAYWHQYSPVGDLEKMRVEQIAAQSLRLARVLGHEQKVFAWAHPFETRSVDKIVRYESSVSRQLEKAILQLERLQEKRKAESSQFEPSDLESDDATNNTDEAPGEPSEAPEELIPEEPPCVTTSIHLPDSSPRTVQPQSEASVTVGSAPVDEDPAKKSVQGAGGTPPPAENGGPKAGTETPAMAIEQATDLTPAERHNGAGESGENCETDRIGSSCWIETAQDAELIERIKPEATL